MIRLVALCVFSLTPLVADEAQDRVDEANRQAAKIEQNRQEDQRYRQKLEDNRLDRQREDDHRYQRKIDDDRWNRAHGY